MCRHWWPSAAPASCTGADSTRSARICSGCSTRHRASSRITEGPRHELKIANRAFHQLVGARELLGRPAFKAFPQLESRALSELLQQVYVTGRPYLGRDLAVRVRPQTGGKAERRYLNFVFQPVFSEDEAGHRYFLPGS